MWPPCARQVRWNEWLGFTPIDKRKRKKAERRAFKMGVPLPDKWQHALERKQGQQATQRKPSPLNPNPDESKPATRASSSRAPGGTAANKQML